VSRFPYKQLRSNMVEFDSTFIRINWGGCAVVAAILAYYLKPLVDEVKIRSYGGWSGSGDVDAARQKIQSNTVREWNQQNIYFSHVWVEFKMKGHWYAIDAEGLHSRKEMWRLWGKPNPGAFSLSEMRELAKVKTGWNSSFNREQIPKMKRMVAKQFKAIAEAC